MRLDSFSSIVMAWIKAAALSARGNVVSHTGLEANAPLMQSGSVKGAWTPLTAAPAPKPECESLMMMTGSQSEQNVLQLRVLQLHAVDWSKREKEEESVSFSLQRQFRRLLLGNKYRRA